MVNFIASVKSRAQHIFQKT